MAGDLVLGPVVFQGFEVPERIRFGGKQRLVVHALPGGGRVVDVLGDQDRPVEWSGVFSGPDAPGRVRLLERLRRSGEVLPLAWEAWRFSVVIESFEAVATNPAWIHYRLKACVIEAAEMALPDEAAFVFTVADALAMGVGEDGAGLEAGIAAAGAALSGSDVAGSIAAAGSLARLVTGRAFLGNIS